jgi:predicted transposase YdaD
MIEDLIERRAAYYRSLMSRPVGVSLIQTIEDAKSRPPIRFEIPVTQEHPGNRGGKKLRGKRLFDRLWKSIIEDMFDYFLEFFDGAMAGQMDMTRFEFLDKELERIYFEDKPVSRRRVADKLIKVFPKDSSKQCLLIHVEIQGDAPRSFSHRMYRYNYLISEKYNLPVTGLAIITGNRKAPSRQYRDVQPFSEIAYKYRVYQVKDQCDESLLQNENPFALIILAAKKALKSGKMTDREIMQDFELIAQKVESRTLTNHQKSIIYAFIGECVRFDDPNNYSRFRNTLESITKIKNPMGVKELFMEIGREEGIQKGIREGIREGIQEGRQQGIQEGIEIGRREKREEDKRSIVKNLLVELDLPDNKVAAIAGVSEGYVRKVKRTLKQ